MCAPIDAGPARRAAPIAASPTATRKSTPAVWTASPVWRCSAVSLLGTSGEASVGTITADWNSVGDAEGSGRIRRGRRQSSEGSAGTDGDGGRRVRHHLFGNVNEVFAANAPVPRELDRDRPFDHTDELAVVHLDRVVQIFLGLVSGSGHDGFVIFNAQDFQNQFIDPGIH